MTLVSKRRHGLLLHAPRCFPVVGARGAKVLAKVLPRTAWERLENLWTEWFLKFFLLIFRFSFCLSPDLRKNIVGFKAKYVFKSRNGSIRESVIFTQDENGDPVMTCEDEPVPDPDVTVVFKDADVLKRYLYSFAGQDILDLILENDVHLEGNWNYVCKLLFMIRELRFKVGQKE
jgi:hypothetical protein